MTGVLMTDPQGSLVVRRVRVRVTGGPDRGRESVLEAGTLLVGTHADNDLVLRDPIVGKYHLEVALVAGGIRLRDLGSDGGTFVGTQRVTLLVVPVGTEITVGRSTLQLLAGDMVVPITPSERNSFGPVIGSHRDMRQLFALLERVAPSDSPVLLEGEPGSGRTLMAKAIHASSRFAASPVTVLDFRSPSSERPSIASTAHRTDTFTLLIENIDYASGADMPLLLSLYERREEGVLDARIVATATRDIRSVFPDEKTRRDLVAHVGAVQLVIPPLRNRMEDVPLLIAQFAREICGAELAFEPGDLDRAMSREYPDNVRELKQLVVRALQMEALPRSLPRAGVARARAALVQPLNARPKPPSPKIAQERLVDWFERDHTARRMTALGGNLNDLSAELKKPKKDLIKELKRWGLIADPKPGTQTK